MVKVSLIIPAYNVAPYIDTSLRSAVAQTLRDIEIIVVDDASSDGTRAVIERYVQLHPTLIRPILLDRNVGVSAARNAALDIAQGEWIANLDADDWMEATRLETLLTHAERAGVDWIADDQYFVVDGESGPRARLIAYEPPGLRRIDATHVVIHDPPAHLGYGLLKPLIRRDFLLRTGLRYHSELRRYEDFLFLIECDAAGAKLALLNEPYYWYRLLRKNSLTKSEPQQVSVEMLKINGRCREVAKAHGMTALDEALAHRERVIERDVRYHRAIAPIKARRWGDAVSTLLNDPLICGQLAQKWFERIHLRLSKRDVFELVLLNHALPRPTRPTPPT